MSGEVHGLEEFYAAPHGVVAARVLRARLRALWPDLTGLDLAGLGWAAPYLDLWAQQRGRRIALVPAGHGPMRCAAARGGAAAMVEEDRLPLGDRSLDRLLLVHALEGCEAPGLLLRECWRVLRDDGKLLALVPNRLGWWSFFEHTPFGQGRPYSPGQLRRLLESQLFHVERASTALFVPPFPWGFALRGAAGWEAAGRLAPRFAGVVLLEAGKDLFAALPAGAVAMRRRVVAPLPAGYGRSAVRAVRAAAITARVRRTTAGSPS